MEYKQVIVLRKDLFMSPGKAASQAAHASLLAYDVAAPEHINHWKRSGITKIVLAIHNESALMSLYKNAVAVWLPTAIVCDEGITEVPPGSITAMAIGPAPKHEIDSITGRLELY